MNKRTTLGNPRAVDSFEQPPDMGQLFVDFVDRQIADSHSLKRTPNSTVVRFSDINHDPEVRYTGPNGSLAGAHYLRHGYTRYIDLREYAPDPNRASGIYTRFHDAYTSIGSVLLVHEVCSYGKYDEDLETHTSRELPGTPQALATILGVDSFQRGLTEDTSRERHTEIRYNMVGADEFAALGRLLIGQEI